MAEAATDRYVVDGRASRFTVRAFATGLLAKMGHNPTIGIRDFSGEMTFNPEKLEAGSFRLVVKSASLSVHLGFGGRDDDVILGLELVIDGRLRHPDRVRDHLQGGATDPFVGEQLERRRDDAGLRGARGVRPRLVVPRLRSATHEVQASETEVWPADTNRSHGAAGRWPRSPGRA